MSAEQPVEHLSDAEFVAAVEGATFPGAAFNHRAHVRLAWCYLRARGSEQGLERLRDTIRRYATALGAPGKFHETMTRAWALCVQGALESTPEAATFEALVAAHPELLDSRLLARHYREETLGSAAARETWVPPDLTPLAVRRPWEWNSGGDLPGCAGARRVE
jgi:hypothetical protein